MSENLNLFGQQLDTPKPPVKPPVKPPAKKPVKPPAKPPKKQPRPQVDKGVADNRAIADDAPQTAQNATKPQLRDDTAALAQHAAQGASEAKGERLHSTRKKKVLGQVPSAAPPVLVHAYADAIAKINRLFDATADNRLTVQQIVYYAGVPYPYIEKMKNEGRVERHIGRVASLNGEIVDMYERIRSL